MPAHVVCYLLSYPMLSAGRVVRKKGCYLPCPHPCGAVYWACGDGRSPAARIRDDDMVPAVNLHLLLVKSLISPWPTVDFMIRFIGNRMEEWAAGQ
ncbi:hypothetical protein ACLOJK_030901 [Asimina triloba]